jgi:hypothetical protein
MTKTTFQRPLLSLALCLVTSLTWGQVPPPPPAPAAAPAAPAAPLTDTLTGPAKESYESAKLLYLDGDFSGALVKFSQALDQSKDPRLLWNMAVCEKNLRHYASVLSLTTRYKAEGGTLLSPTDVQDADQLIEVIRPFVAPISVSAQPEGAKVTLDGQAVGTLPLAGPLMVDIGTHELTLSKDGYAPHTQRLDIKGGGEIAISVTLEEVRHVGTLAIFAGAKDEILVDGNKVGTGEFTGELPSGAHRIEVRGGGMRPYDSEVLVQDGQRASVRVKLDPVPKDDQGGVPVWLWLVGGVAVAGGATVGVLAATGTFTSTPEPIAGTINPGTVVLPLSFR